MSELLRRATTYWPLTVILVALPLIAVLLYGCESSPRPPVVVQERDTGERCAALLESGIGMVRPESLGLVAARVNLNSDPRQAADTLTQWLRRPDCRDATPVEPLSDESRELISRLLGAEANDELTAERLSAFDAANIRDALLEFEAADNLSRGSNTDLDRVMRLFEYVTRTVTLQGAGSSDEYLTAYEAHLFGRGTAENRAWLFASMLRQLRIDAVILRPTGGTGDADPWLVGVLLGGDVYLFDIELGLPVPAPGAGRAAAPSYLPMPATWSQVLEDPEMLLAHRAAAGLEGTSLTADQLSLPKVELIGPTSFWKPVMERLELSLRERGVLLYDPLHDTREVPGVYRRVVEAGDGHWRAESVSVWPYTARVQGERTDINESQRQRLQARIRPYLGPISIEGDGVSGGGVGSPSKLLWGTRIEHMSGRPGSALASYGHIRLAGEPDPALSPNDQSINSQAADEAFYWTAHAQFAGGQYSSAVSTLRSYIDRAGDRTDEAAALVVLCLAAEGKLDEAAEAVDNLAETTPGLPRLRWLAGWWRGDSPPQSTD